MMLEASMETSLYPDEGCQSTSYVKMRSLKQKMTLDLDGQGGPSCKRGRYGGGGLLSSPDLNMLKLGSPELESLLIQQHGHVTTTPTASGGQYSGGGGGYPKTVTEEQELYARGFVEALAELHQTEEYASTEGELYQDPSSPSTTTSSCTNDYHMQGYLNHPPPPHYTDFILPINIKEEPQTVPNRETPPLSPIDMMAQERIKLERKRQRNRLAASKCRRRKLERIARLEDKVKILKDDNSELGNVVAKLKDHICRLKEQLMEHVNNGCQVMPALNNEYS